MNISMKPEAGTTEREHTRTGLSKDALKQAYIDNLFYLQGRVPEVATPHDFYMAAAYTVRDRLLDRWHKTAQTYKNNQVRTVCYLSAEFLLGPHLMNSMINLGIVEQAREAGEKLGLDFWSIMDTEQEPGWVTAASGGSPPASWIRSPRWRFPPSATASATSSASSIR